MGNRARRTAAGAGAFLDGFFKGQESAGRMIKDRQDEDVRGQIAATDENFTPRSTPVAAGDEALAAGQQAHQDALKSAVSEEEIAAVDSNFKPTLDALRKDQSRPASVAYSMGTGGAFKQQDEPFSTGDVEGAKARERATIYQRAGREDDAARVLLNASRSRELADQDAIRGAYATPAGTAAKGIPGGAKEAEAGRPAADAADFLPQYLERIAPRVQAEYIRQGKITEAKAFQDLLESQDGKNYTKNWTNAVRKIEMGDLDGAVPDLAKLYTSYPDGKRAQATRLDGGRYQIDMISEATGETVNSFALESGDLVRKAAMALRPEKLAEFLATQEGKRTAEAASLDKSLEVEGLRQEGQEARDDRRDARLVKQIDAANARHAQGRGLTAAQERSNAEIDAARDATAGLTPDEIKRRTNKTSDTGRENKEYDGTLARQVTLAGRRKVGDDPDFGTRQGPAPAKSKQTPIQAAREALAADTNMAGMTLGEQTVKGFKVLDANGRHVGYFGRSK